MLYYLRAGHSERKIYGEIQENFIKYGLSLSLSISPSVVRSHWECLLHWEREREREQRRRRIYVLRENIVQTHFNGLPLPLSLALPLSLSVRGFYGNWALLHYICKQFPVFSLDLTDQPFQPAFTDWHYIKFPFPFPYVPGWHYLSFDFDDFIEIHNFKLPLGAMSTNTATTKVPASNTRHTGSEQRSSLTSLISICKYRHTSLHHVVDDVRVFVSKTLETVGLVWPSTLSTTF